MKKIILFIALLATINSCKKEECCIKPEDSKAFYKNYENNYYCAFDGKSFEYVFYNYDKFLENSNETTGCYWDNPVVVPLDFTGVIMCYGVETKYYHNIQEIDIIIDKCNKKINYKLKIIQQDTMNIDNYYESVITVIDSIPKGYEVEFSHEIIPYKE